MPIFSVLSRGDHSVYPEYGAVAAQPFGPLRLARHSKALATSRHATDYFGRSPSSEETDGDSDPESASLTSNNDSGSGSDGAAEPTPASSLFSLWDKDHESLDSGASAPTPQAESADDTLHRLAAAAERLEWWLDDGAPAEDRYIEVNGEGDWFSVTHSLVMTRKSSLDGSEWEDHSDVREYRQYFAQQDWLRSVTHLPDLESQENLLVV